MSDNEQHFEFDKFMDSIVKEEITNVPVQQQDDKTDARRYAERYRELPQNRTRYQK